MKDLETIKEEYAKERGRKSWDNLLYSTTKESHSALYDIVTKRYAKALLEEAAEKIDRSQIGELDQWDEGYNKGIERAVKIISSLQIKQQ